MVLLLIDTGERKRGRWPKSGGGSGGHGRHGWSEWGEVEEAGSRPTKVRRTRTTGVNALIPRLFLHLRELESGVSVLRCDDMGVVAVGARDHSLDVPPPARRQHDKSIFPCPPAWIALSRLSPSCVGRRRADSATPLVCTPRACMYTVGLGRGAVFSTLVRVLDRPASPPLAHSDMPAGCQKYLTSFPDYSEEHCCFLL